MDSRAILRCIYGLHSRPYWLSRNIDGMVYSWYIRVLNPRNLSKVTRIQGIYQILEVM